MAKYYVYIIKNLKIGKRYKGMTMNLEERIKEHNSGKTKSTKQESGWELEYFEIFESRLEARKR